MEILISGENNKEKNYYNYLGLSSCEQKRKCGCQNVHFTLNSCIVSKKLISTISDNYNHKIKKKKKKKKKK
jgi:hypothetical protein